MMRQEVDAWLKYKEPIAFFYCRIHYRLPYRIRSNTALFHLQYRQPQRAVIVLQYTIC